MLISPSDKNLLNQHNITVDIDRTRQRGIITFDNRRLSVSLISRSPGRRSEWKSLPLNEQQMIDTANKVAVMLLKKEFLQSKPEEALNFKINQVGIAFTSQKKFTRHDDAKTANTVTDYKEIVDYLSPPEPVVEPIELEEKPPEEKPVELEDKPLEVKPIVSESHAGVIYLSTSRDEGISLPTTSVAHKSLKVSSEDLFHEHLALRVEDTAKSTFLLKRKAKRRHAKESSGNRTRSVSPIKQSDARPEAQENQDVAIAEIERQNDVLKSEQKKEAEERTQNDEQATSSEVKKTKSIFSTVLDYLSSWDNG